MHMRWVLKVSAVLVLSACSASGSSGVQAGGLPCPVQGVADYSGEPGFETPEEALAWALETQTQLVTGPGDEGEYVKVPQDAQWVNFEYRVGNGVHHTWEVIRQDGAWGVGARSGCMPDFQDP